MIAKQLTVRGLTLGDGVPKICVPITAADEGELKQQIGRFFYAIERS